jgi:hypothetical protein
MYNCKIKIAWKGLQYFVRGMWASKVPKIAVVSRDLTKSGNTDS